MFPKSLISAGFACAALLALSTSGMAGGTQQSDSTMDAGLAGGPVLIEDAYVRSSGANARAGAAFMVLTNTSDTALRLVEARTDAAARVELHTHIESDQGVMQMREIEGGLPLPAGATHVLKRGGDHVMLMGLTGPLEHGQSIEITLIFQDGSSQTATIPVDQERKANHRHMDHDH